MYLHTHSYQCRSVECNKNLCWENGCVGVVLGKALKEYEQLMKKYSETSAKNDQLSEECRRYLEEFKRMEAKIANLKHEIDERNRQASFTHYQRRQPLFI